MKIVRSAREQTRVGQIVLAVAGGVFGLLLAEWIRDRWFGTVSKATEMLMLLIATMLLAVVIGIVAQLMMRRRIETLANDN